MEEDAGLGQATVLELCGAGEMHPQADLVGVLNDKLVFAGADHSWCSSGNSSNFIQALDFTTDFLFPLLPCNNTTAITEVNSTQRKLLKITDVLGRSTTAKQNTPLFYIYDDVSVEKQVILNWNWQSTIN